MILHQGKSGLKCTHAFCTEIDKSRDAVSVSKGFTVCAGFVRQSHVVMVSCMPGCKCSTCHLQYDGVTRNCVALSGMHSKLCCSSNNTCSASAPFASMRGHMHGHHHTSKQLSVWLSVCNHADFFADLSCPTCRTAKYGKPSSGL